MKFLKNRPAFSMLELVFVIVILGIVASIGAQVIAQVYENYVVQRGQHRASIKTQLAANLIANRLRYVIPGTIVRRTGIAGAAETLETTMGSTADAYTVLQWVAYDGDSFESIASGANRSPGWSGFCDVDASSDTVLSTPGSNLGLTNTIIQNLSGGTKSISDATLFFPEESTGGHGISSGADTTITLDTNVSRIVEHYKIAWSSYALVVDGGDLFLYHNFPPTVAAPLGETRSLLLRNIANFKFQGAGRTTRFKLCKEERVSESFNVTSCKEKVVF